MSIWNEISLSSMSEIEVNSIGLTVMASFDKEYFTDLDIVKLEMVLAALDGIDLKRFEYNGRYNIYVDSGSDWITIAFDHEYHLRINCGDISIDDIRFSDGKFLQNRAIVRFDNPDFIKDVHRYLVKLEKYMALVRSECLTTEEQRIEWCKNDDSE